MNYNLKNTFKAILSLLATLLFCFQLSSQVLVKGSGIRYYQGYTIATYPTATAPVTSVGTEFSYFIDLNIVCKWDRVNSRWVPVNNILVQSGVPAHTPNTGDPLTYLDKDTGNLYKWNGSAWELLINAGSTVTSITNLGDTTSLTPITGDEFVVATRDTSGVYSIDRWLLRYGGGGGAATFTDLTDTPSSYVGQGNKLTIVKNDETGVEFLDTTGLFSGGGATIARNTRGDSLQVGTGIVADDDDPQNSPMYLRNNIKWIGKYLFNTWFRGTPSQSTDDYNIVLVGDSKTEFNNIARGFKTQLAERWIIDGPGFLQVDGSMSQLNAAASPAFSTAKWDIRNTDSDTLGLGLSLYTIVSRDTSTAFGWVNQSSNFQYNTYDSLDVWYYGRPDGGTFSISLDGTILDTIDTSIGLGFQIVSFNGFSDVQHTVLITPITPNAEIIGFNAHRRKNAVRFHKVGQSGAMASDYIAIDSAIWNPQYRELDPHLLLVYLGTNNRAQEQTIPAFKAEMKTFVARMKAAKPNVDIVLLGQSDYDPDNIFTGTEVATTAAYNDVLRQIAIEDTTAYFDIEQISGLFDLDKQFFDDGLHESERAGFIIARDLIEGIPMLGGNINIRTQFEQQFGFSEPVSTTQTPNRVLYSNSGGTVATNPGFTFDGTSLSVTGGNITAGGTVVSAGLSSTGSVTQTGGTFRYKNFAIIDGNNILTSGGTQGIRTDGVASGMRFQTSNQLIRERFVYENFAAVGAGIHSTGTTSLVILKQSFGGGFSSNTTLNLHSIASSLTPTSNNTNNRIRGYFFNPSLAQPRGVKVIGYENTIGDNYYNSIDGSTSVGRDSTENIEATAMLEISSTEQGFLPPRMTTAQRDSIGWGISSVSVSAGGSGYTSFPQVTIVGENGKGRGAIVTALTSAGVITGFTVRDRGAGYSGTPTVTIVEGGGTGATATVTTSFLAPPPGLTIYNTSTNRIEVWNGSIWEFNSDDQTASEVTITDTESVFDSTTVEGALEELDEMSRNKFFYISSSNTLPLAKGNTSVMLDGTTGPFTVTFNVVNLRSGDEVKVFCNGGSVTLDSTSGGFLRPSVGTNESTIPIDAEGYILVWNGTDFFQVN